MEAVTLVRAPRDDDDEPVPGVTAQLQAVAVAPGSSEGNKDRGRDGQAVAYTVYFWPIPGQPLPEFSVGDRLRVRGDTCSTVAREWVSPRTGRRGLEVLCSSGRG